MLDYLDDIESDMSVFHRVDDIYDMEGPRFFKMAWRLPAYSGVMTARLEEERQKPSSGASRDPNEARAIKYANKYGGGTSSQVDNVHAANAVANDPIFDIG